MYISKGYDDCKTLNMDVPNDKFFDDVSIGDTVQVTVKGKVKGLDAPHEGPDYDIEPKAGQKRPMKVYPGRMTLEISEEPQAAKIRELNELLDSEE
jgi:hypothetical protein